MVTQKSSMVNDQKQKLTQDEFDNLLLWLDADRERAGKKYENIRHSLIKIFSWRGCAEAEDLADETIDRVGHKVKVLAPTYTGDPALYFFGVAKKLLLEYNRRKTALQPLPAKLPDLAEPQAEPDASEQMRECLRNCLQRLSPQNRDLILSYYQQTKRAKIDSRKGLAQKLTIAANALRVRVHRIRTSMQICIENCLKEQKDETY
jgi:RNA polymerase sigma factor (sigma-70 family)